MSKFASLRKQLAENKARAAGGSFFRIPDGRTTVRVLPASSQDSEENFYRPIGQHFNVKPDKPVVCPAFSDNREDDCPICDLANLYRANGDEELARQIQVRKQFLFRILVRGKESDGVQIAMFPTTVFNAIAEILSNEEEYGDCLDFKEGRDFIITRSGSGLSTRYQVAPAGKSSPILNSAKSTKALLNNLGSIFDYFTIPSSSELKALIASMGEDDDEEDSTSSKSSDVWEDDDEDIEDDIEDSDGDDAEDDDTEESLDDDEDEDMWEDDDDEDEEPVKKAVSKTKRKLQSRMKKAAK